MSEISPERAATVTPGQAAYEGGACSVCGGPLTAKPAASPAGDCQGDETGADTERRLREQRDRLTERAAELVTEGNELRARMTELEDLLAEAVNPTAEDYDNAAEILRLRDERDRLRELLNEARIAEPAVVTAGTEHLVPLIRGLAIGAEDQP